MDLDLQPVQKKLDLQPVTPMSPDNAAKMRELYPDAVPELDLKPVPSSDHAPLKITVPNPAVLDTTPKLDLQPVKIEEKKLDLQPAASTPAIEGVGSEIYRRGIRAATDSASNVKDQFTKPFAKDESSGPELLQRIGDIGGRAAGAVADTVTGVVGTPVRALGETAMNRALVPLERRGEPGIEKAIQNAGDLLTDAALVPGPLKKFGKAAAVEDAVKDAVKTDPATKTPGIFSDDNVPTASTKNAASPTGMADRLYQLRGQVTADNEELNQWLKTVQPNVPKATWDKFLDHVDDPKGTPLTPEETALFEKSIKPLMEEEEKAIKEVENAGLKVDDVIEDTPPEEAQGGARRQVVGKNTPMDRLIGTTEKGPSIIQRLKGLVTRQPVGGRSLSKSAGALRPRSMFALTDESGARRVVHVDDEGNVFDAKTKGEPLGQVDAETGKVSDGSTLGQATRKEISEATNGKIKYHGNSLGVYATSVLQVRRAARVIRYLKDLKSDSDFSSIGRAPMTKGAIPKGWVEIPNMPVFRGWHFDPRAAEPIEDMLKLGKKQGPITDALDGVGRFLTSALFWANPIHMFNLGNMFLVTKGAGGLVKDLPKTVRNFPKAVKSVLNRDKVYLAQTRAGVANLGLDNAGRDMAENLVKTMGEHARQDPKGFAEFAKVYGMKPVELLKRVGQWSHKLTFDFGDILQQTLIRDEMDKGLSLPEATEKVGKTFVNYRVPTRVLGDRNLGKAMQSPMLFRFPGYTYGLLKGLGNMVKGAGKLDAHSLDQLIAMGALSAYGAYVADPIIQKLTGNPDASMGRSGYEKFPEMGRDLVEGNKTVGQNLMGVASPGYLPMAGELGYGRDLYTGKPISLPGESAKEVGKDYFNYAAGQVNPLAKFMDVYSGKKTAEEAALAQLGIKDPSLAERNSKQKAIKYNRNQLKSKRKKEMQ